MVVVLECLNSGKVVEEVLAMMVMNNKVEKKDERERRLAAFL